MSTNSTTRRLVAVFAVAMLAFSLVMVWSVVDVRERRAMAETKNDLVKRTVTERRAPDDYDGDGIADGADRCPTRPETENGFQDGDGCPDVVATTGAS